MRRQGLNTPYLSTRTKLNKVYKLSATAEPLLLYRCCYKPFYSSFMKLYRIQSLNNESMWYSFDGKFTDKIKNITGQSIPMPFEEFRQKNKKVKLLSSVDDMMMFPNWFAKQQIERLFNSGYSLFEYKVDSCICLPKGETLFDFNRVISRKEIQKDIVDVFYPNGL